MICYWVCKSPHARTSRSFQFKADLATKMWISLLLLLPLVTADYFKETQDFKYSRSDGKGEQKGFYGAQTGNMGGNYEVAHNMDNTAESQMKNLMHQVGSQLGIDATAIGTGQTSDAMGAGSIYGSASASGKSVHKGLQTDYGMNGAHNSRTGSSYSSTHGAAASGSRGSQQFSNYDNYGANRQDNLRHQTLVVPSVGENIQQSSGQYGSGSRHAESSVNSHGTAGSRHAESSVNNHGTAGREHGERYGSRGTNYQTEDLYRQNAGSRSVASEPQYETANSGYQNQKSFSTYGASGSQNTGTVIQPIPLGGAVKLIVRPGQTIRTTIPILVPVQPSETNKLQSGYVQSSSYGSGDSRRQNIHSDSQIYGGGNLEETQGSRVIGAGIDNDHERTSGTKGYQSSYSYTKEWEKHGSSASQPKYVDVALTRPINTETFDNTDNLRSHDTSRTSYGTNYHSGRQNVALSRDKTANTYVTAGKNVDDLQYGSRSHGSTSGNQYQSSYSNQNEWENQQKGESWSRNADLARSSDRVSTAHVGAVETNEGRTGHSSGSRVVGLNGHVNGQRQNIDISNQYGAAHQNENTDQSYDASGRNLNTNLDSTVHTVGQPKSYQSSYSYSKSWESHGTPQQSVGGENSDSKLRGSSFTVPVTRNGNEHLGNMESQYGSTGQQNSRYSGSSSSYGQNHMSSSHGAQGGETLTTDMDRLQQQLRGKMNEMCTTCGEAKTKGYSAQYSYSAQRSYGGSQAGHESQRRKRKVDNRGERGELDEYENVSIQNKIADYKKWEEQVKDLRKRVKNMIAQLSENDKNVKTTPTPTPTTQTSRKTAKDFENNNYHSRHRGNKDRDVELIENDNVAEEVKDIDDLRNKISGLRHKIKTLLRVQHEDDDLTKEIEVLNKKINDFESHINNPKKETNIGKRRNIRDINFEQETEYIGQQTEDIGQQTVDLGQQTEDLKQGDFYLGQQTEDLGQSSLQFGRETQNYKETTYAGQQTHHLGQQTENLGQGSLQFGQETQNYKETTYAGQQTQHLGQQTENLGQGSLQFGQETQNYKETTYAGQQTHHLGQQTEDLGQSSLQFGQETQNYKETGQYTGQQTQNLGQQTEDKYTGGQQTSHTGQQTHGRGQDSLYVGRERQTSTQNQQNSQGRSHSQSSNKDDFDINHILEIQRSLQTNKPSGTYTSQSNLKPVGQQSGNYLTNGHRGDQIEQQSFINAYPREDSGQQTMSFGEVGPEVETSNLRLKVNDTSNQNLHFAQTDYDLGQQTLQVDDWPQNGELQVAQRETVKPVNNNLHNAETYNQNHKIVEKQETVEVTTTPAPGFWNKAKSWFG